MSYCKLSPVPGNKQHKNKSVPKDRGCILEGSVVVFEVEPALQRVGFSTTAPASFTFDALVMLTPGPRPSYSGVI